MSRGLGDVYKRQGDEFAEIDGDYYHVECLENMTTRELLALLDVYTETAEMEGDGW